MREFDFLEPASVAEASQMLAAHGDDARVMAGGTALMLALRQRMVMPTHIVSVARIDALRGLSFDPLHGLRIGALTRHIDVATAPLVRAHYPMLAAMAAHLANPQVRHQGTIGGNLCYADPATDPPTSLMALDARVVLGSARGERVLPIEDFLVDYYATALEPDEIVVEIRVPAPAGDQVGKHARFLRIAADHRPLVSVALVAQRSGNNGSNGNSGSNGENGGENSAARSGENGGNSSANNSGNSGKSGGNSNGSVCHAARVVVGASTPVPCRVPRAEAFLEGKTITPAVAAEAADIIATDIEPLSDQRGQAQYRRDMVRVVARRTIARLYGLTGPTSA